MAAIGESLSKIALHFAGSTPRMNNGVSIELRGCGQIQPQVGWKFPNHVHGDMHEMIFVVRGQIETQIAGQTLLGRKGDVLWYPQGAAHSERALGRELFETLFVSFQIAPAPSAAPASLPLIVFDRDGRIEQQLRWISDLHPMKTNEERCIANCLIHTAFFEHRRLAETPASTDIVLSIKRYIRAHISDPLTLDDLADDAGLSRYYFSRVFRRKTGITPMDYVRRLRVEAAQALILRTPLPLKAIAAQVGFCDEYHFSRVFRKETGQPPGALRKGR
jgi:AraC-like DNA-binding protein